MGTEGSPLSVRAEGLAGLATAALVAREAAVSSLEEQAEAVARACHAMAVRFHQGGKLLVFGAGAPTTDAQHVSVEFVHPVIVGKRALPALSLTNDVATLTGVATSRGMEEVFAYQVAALGGPDDIAMGLSFDGHSEAVRRGLQAAHERGLLTIALLGGDGGPIASDPAVDHALVIRSGDPLVVKEAHVTAYHILWELVHVFFEQPGVLSPEVIR